MIKAVIFDCDGLLIDTETAWFEAFSNIYREHGAELSLEFWAHIISTHNETLNPYTHLSDLIGQPIDQLEIRKKAEEKHALLMQSVTLRPGVEEYLRTAKSLGMRIGLASSSNREWVEDYVRRFDIIDYFDCICTSSDVLRVKPDPELYLQAISRLGVDATEAVAFEDSPNGTRAAVAAGLHCVIVPNGLTANYEFDAYDLRITSMADLPLQDVLARLQTQNV
jgi:HAD superfamily hydrolase (TIGR01509 family)